VTEVFRSYARHYDTIYRERDYERECDALESVIAHCGGPVVNQILDAGCGTGTHALILARRGHKVVGVDSSEEMLAVARNKAASSKGSVQFVAGNVASLGLGRKFDVVTCLFGVLSYQLDNEQVMATLRSFRNHLKVGGLLMLDFWSGGGVLTEGPSERKIDLLCADGTRVVRIAKPLGVDFAAQTNATEYSILHLDGSRVIDECTEVHQVRYFFPQEIKHYARESGFDVISLVDGWTSETELGAGKWVGMLVARAR
jgi:ubiquinone/menaquinone biosynthesis C-methylase UbiE